MTKILLISNYQAGIGGINAQVDLLQQFINQEDGWQADIFSTKGNPLRRGVAFFKLLSKARKYNVQHIHACSYWGMVPAVFGIIAGKLWRKRTIITYHGGEAKEYFAKHASFVRRWLGKADEVIVLSGFLKEIFDQHQIPCVVIPNIVVLRQQTERTTTIAPKFISIRHHEPLYNIPCILQAYEQVLKQYPEATLDILGQGSLRAELEAYVQEHNMTGVTFVGQVPNNMIYDYLSKADIMLSAARIDNMPVSLLEAMNAGLLVIASRVGGVPFMIVEPKAAMGNGQWDAAEPLSAMGNGQWAIDKETNSQSPMANRPQKIESPMANSQHNPTGLLFESENANDLASKMLWALEHPEQVNTMIINAQTDVQKYSWEKVKEQLFEVYNQFT